MESQKNDDKSDDIDLGHLFNKMGEFLINVWMTFMRLLALTRRVPFENKLSFTLIIATSIILGLLFSYFIKKNYYESTMILSSNYLNKRLADNAVDKLDALAKEERKEGLRRVLNLPDTLAKNIIGFSVAPFVAETDVIELEILKEQLRAAQANAKNPEVIEQVIKRIEIENRHAFEITVRLLNPSMVSNLQDAIVLFFQNNPYLKKRIESNRQNLLRRKTKLESDVAKLDSLKNIIYENYSNMATQARQGSNNVILSDEAVTDPVDIYNQDLLIYNELQTVNSDLYLQKDFEIVDGFTEFSEPASASKAKIFLYSLLIGITVAYLDVALRSFNKYLANLK